MLSGGGKGGMGIILKMRFIIHVLGGVGKTSIDAEALTVGLSVCDCF